MKGTRVGGRQKGTPNKFSAETKELLNAFIYRRIETILAKEAEIDRMPIDEQVKIIKPLLPYALEKPQVTVMNKQEDRVVFHQHISHPIVPDSQLHLYTKEELDELERRAKEVEDSNEGCWNERPLLKVID